MSLFSYNFTMRTFKFASLLEKTVVMQWFPEYEIWKVSQTFRSGFWRNISKSSGPDAKSVLGLQFALHRVFSPYLRVCLSSCCWDPWSLSYKIQPFCFTKTVFPPQTDLVFSSRPHPGQNGTKYENNSTSAVPFSGPPSFSFQLPIFLHYQREWCSLWIKKNTENQYKEKCDGMLVFIC